MADNKFKGTEDSWLIDGNCTNCRRNTYCSKDCKKHKERMYGVLRSMIADKMGGDFLNQLESYSEDLGN